ncbi:MAG: hypothetical protein RIE52_12170 [Balneola sp.]
MTGTINRSYLEEYFDTPEEMNYQTGIDPIRCERFFFQVEFVGTGHDFQKMLKSGIDLNRLLQPEFTTIIKIGNTKDIFK